MADDKQQNKESTQAKDLKDDKGMPEWLTPILSALGSMGGSYMLFIKPLQERMDAVTNQINDLREEVKELKQQNKDYRLELQNVNSQLENNLNGAGYLTIKKPIQNGNYKKGRI